MTNNINYWNNIRKRKHDKPLRFVHTPKCGGSFTSNILKKLDINNNFHKQASKQDITNSITFTVIRHPVERFESLLNYRLSEPCPRNDWLGS